MKKTLFTLLICFGAVGISFGQININGGVYSDSTLTKPISAQIILKSKNGMKTYRTDQNGKFNISSKVGEKKILSK